jgi:hypothetical protein
MALGTARATWDPPRATSGAVTGTSSDTDRQCVTTKSDSSRSPMPFYTSRGHFFPVSFARRGARVGLYFARSLFSGFVRSPGCAGWPAPRWTVARRHGRSHDKELKPEPICCPCGAANSGKPTSSGAVPANPRTPAPPKQKKKLVTARSIRTHAQFREFSHRILKSVIYRASIKAPQFPEPNVFGRRSVV